MEITVDQNSIGKRLDVFLTENIKDHSRSFWQKEIKIGRVNIDGKKVTPHIALKLGNVINIAPAPAVEKIPVPKLDIIADEKDFLIINKPIGLLVHKTDNSNEPTLVDSILNYEPKIATVGDDASRPGIVHRLDRDVSGVMVIAKTNSMFEHLKKQFAERTISKEYTALVYGELPKDEGEITFKIGYKKEGGRMAARPTDSETDDSREARTKYEVIKRLPNLTLVKVKPETGRSHQIRAHFFALGHPIVGDPLYKNKKDKNDEKGPGRIMLHSTKISFTDLEGNAHAYESPLPEEFKKFLNL